MSIGTKGRGAAALQKIGLTAEGPYFTKCYSMLDPQRSNPNDPMHAEIRLRKYFSDALIEGMLSPSWILAYREADHGRMAIMNPFVLVHLFTNQHSKHSIQTKTYLKAGIDARTRTTFYQELDAQQEAKSCILRTSYALVMTVYMTLKKSLTIEEQRNLHLAVYQKYADVPNIHLRLHYAEDILNFATTFLTLLQTFNATTTMGEQQHKVLKQHAGHTNSHKTDLQLLKLINTSKTVRFRLNGIYEGSECSHNISK
ncbi:hypothetical protein DFP73DRAFT_600775 [Morchella snyderi]|nr:hypothetical protein DFP73DRAFT_600775 [Morchella snyderi]